MKLFLVLMMLIYTDLEIWPTLQVYMELVLQDAQIAQDIYLICSCELPTSNFSRSHVMMKVQILAPGALHYPWRSEIGMNEAG
jgi:hypothetical protein